jgi:hypothetical protein
VSRVVKPLGERVRRETEQRIPMALSSRRITVLKGDADPGCVGTRDASITFVVIVSGVVVALSVPFSLGLFSALPLEPFVCTPVSIVPYQLSGFATRILATLVLVASIPCSGCIEYDMKLC